MRSGSRQPRAFLLIATSLLSFVGASSSAQEARSGDPPSPRPAYIQRPESELLLFDVRLGQNVLAEAIPAYPIKGGVLVPLQELCSALDFAITVDVASGGAAGFFIAENRRFALDVPGGRVTVEGKPGPFDATRVEVHQDDIYVDSLLFSAWFPVDVTVDFSSLVLTIRPRETLPIQKKQERAQRASKEMSSLGLAGPRYPPTDNPYRLLDVPFVDQTLRATLAKSGGQSTQGFQYSTFATGDVLFHEASAYIFGDQHGIEDVRASLGRRDPSGGLLGPLGAREYAAGDVLFPGLETISLPRSGPGFLVSNYPLQLQTQFDRHTFRGDLPQGWEVELYQNRALIGFQQSRPDGLYEFINIPLVFGLNEFRLIFYGPQGQRREETARFNIAESLTPAGSVYYRAVGNDPRGSTRRGQLDLDFGISRNFSASFDASTVELEKMGRHDYGRVGLRGYSSILFADAEVVADRNGGVAASAAVQTRVGPLGVTARYTSLQNDFVSETFLPTYGVIRSRTSVRFDATIPAGRLSGVPAVVDLSEDRLASGQTVDHVSGRLSGFYRGIAMSNLLDWTFARGEPQLFPDSAVGDFLVSKFVRNYGLRGEVIYALKPTAEVTTVALTAERIFPAYYAQLGVSRNVSARQTHLLGTLTRTDGPFGFGANLDYARPGGLSVALTWNASFTRDPRSGKWRTQARSLAGMGAISPLVYLDENGNGVRDPGEKPMEGVTFFSNRASSEVKTGADGTALLTGLPIYQDVDFSVAGSSLEDPLAVSEKPGVRFVPRPGHVTKVEFPILISGEITGTVRVRREGSTREASGVLVQLVDKEGKVVKQVRSAYDGFYDMTLIVPGEYRIQVSVEQASRLNLVAPPPRAISIAPNGTILDGIDLRLEEAPR
jgi:hypothetical protein